MTFRPGDLLTVSPSSDDDPVAQDWKGLTVKFIRWSNAGHCVVDYNGKQIHLRPEDLSK